MTMIQCISPVDGSVYAERAALSLDAAKDVVARARKAQKAWAKRPLEERVQLVLKGVARLNEMSDVVVPELAWQMGRPVKYGGEYKGFNERSNYVASIAADALAPLVVEESERFERRIEREAHVFRWDRSWIGSGCQACQIPLAWVSRQRRNGALAIRSRLSVALPTMAKIKIAAKIWSGFPSC